jgi:hypothetical protein
MDLAARRLEKQMAAAQEGAHQQSDVRERCFQWVKKNRPDLF